MFTGIVEATGLVVSREATEKSTRFMVEAGALVEGTKIGDSVATNGCCLTVVAVEGSRLVFDMLEETLLRTNLKSCRVGAAVNLERSLRADGRLGGHFVSGHVDGTGVIKTWERVEKDHILEIGIAAEWGRYLVPKGCIAVDGMSLTVVEVKPAAFTIWIIPHTLEITALRERSVGDEVNVEFDLVAKYTEKILAARASAA
jgi:riboflavin synthase